MPRLQLTPCSSQAQMHLMCSIRSLTLVLAISIHGLALVFRDHDTRTTWRSYFANGKPLVAVQSPSGLIRYSDGSTGKESTLHFRELACISSHIVADTTERPVQCMSQTIASISLFVIYAKEELQHVRHLAAVNKDIHGGSNPRAF
jgi:hypothetical protein